MSTFSVKYVSNSRGKFTDIWSDGAYSQITGHVPSGQAIRFVRDFHKRAKANQGK